MRVPSEMIQGPVLAQAAASSPRPSQTPPSQVYDLLIRDDPQLDSLIAEGGSHVERIHLIQQLLTVSVVGLVLYGATVGLAAQFFEADGRLGTWIGGCPLLSLPIAMTAAFLLAQVVCLPSFYFYTLVSGLDASFQLVTAQALRVQARTAVLLLGVLPVYTAVVLAALVSASESGGDIIVFGLLLPSIVGLAGVVSLYQSFQRLSHTLPIAHTRRSGFVSRMVIAWSVAYSVVCPVALYRIGQALAL